MFVFLFIYLICFSNYFFKKIKLIFFNNFDEIIKKINKYFNIFLMKIYFYNNTLLNTH